MCVRAVAVDGSAIALAAHAKPTAAALQFINPPIALVDVGGDSILTGRCQRR
jgi:hypothetical protein